MPRYRIIIEYDGTPFVGWQMQAKGASIQGQLCQALEKLSGERPEVRGAGRTDSGVHALGQVAHFDLTKSWDTFRLREAINFHLRPDPIVAIECCEAAPDFDARFSARKRHYLYRILSRRSPPALDRNRVWWLPFDLDADAMAAAAQELVGRWDFTTFRAAGCQGGSPVRTLDRLDVTRRGSEIEIRASARSFLHHQIRSITGCLKLVGEGRWTRADLAAARDALDRARCGPVAPARGLYFVAVDYPASEPPAPSAVHTAPDGTTE